MVELVGTHRLDQAKVVDVFFQVWQAVRYPLAALPCLMEGVLRAQQLRDTADKSKPFARQKRSGTLLTVEPGQIGLVIEELQLAGCAGHVQVNNPLGAAGKLRRQDS